MRQHLLIGGGRHDNPGHHHRMDEVVRGVGQPPGVRRLGDHPCAVLRAAVEVDPPQGDTAGEGRDEGRDRRGGDFLPHRQGLADDDDRLAEGDDDERLAALGEVAARDGPLVAGCGAHSRDVEANLVAEQVHPESGQPHQLAGVAGDERAGHPDASAGHRPQRDTGEDPLDPLPAHGDRDERGPSDLHQHVRPCDDQPAGSERQGQRRRQHQADQHQRDQHQPHRYPAGIQPVRRPGRVDPRPPHQREQQRGLQRAVHGRQGEQMVRHLGDGEHVYQVEEQLDVSHPLLTGMVLEQAARVMTRAYGRLVASAHHTIPYQLPQGARRLLDRSSTLILPDSVPATWSAVSRRESREV